jgi:hypothetical protein
VNDDTKQELAAVAEAAGEAAVEVVRHRWTRKLARLGFYCKGFLFVVIGVIAITVLAGVRGSSLLDQQGALAAIATEPYGKVLLLIFVAGSIGHGIWNILRGIADIDDLGRHWFSIFKRIIAAAIGVFYLGLAVSALEIVIAARVEPAASQAEETFVGFLLMLPVFGAIWAIIIGIGLIAGGIAQVYIGLSGQFKDAYHTWQISGVHRAVITLLGWLSFCVRAMLLIVIGWFFIKASVNGRPGPIGLDAALLALLTTVYGPLLIGVAAAGLISHGILAFYEAKYRRIC